MSSPQRTGAGTKRASYLLRSNRRNTSFGLYSSRRGTGSVGDMAQVLSGRVLKITERQREVVELIAAGLSNDEVGERLGISPRTAKAHCDVLRQKLGVPRRRQIPIAYRLLTGEDPLLQSLGSNPSDSGD
ncbi:MAG TPA: helix-turn-helix transcriptional regulator [Gaiellaceae bacterium]|nr:helix-turn-helix transcriptional regulator [Gaiellaceae bacterium]